MKRQKVTSDSVQSTSNDEREFRDLEDDKEDGIGIFDYICSLATYGFHYIKQKKDSIVPDFRDLFLEILI